MDGASEAGGEKEIAFKEFESPVVDNSPDDPPKVFLVSGVCDIKTVKCITVPVRSIPGGNLSAVFIFKNIIRMYAGKTGAPVGDKWCNP